ncbi:hypothetical protein HYFRA_00001829 [Hymenoscyphus fraxineus]|uniref:SWIRM domain-containing protein n=1 Tax=Hymenoscyphus fraxineus TaxID=746836 RepID=A0A9N9KKM9_9HELO|nr:hypothetical protein HYFRA_00001829 [Hymenoscyphus fraxineus]
MDDQRNTLLPSARFGDSSSLESNSYSRTIRPANSPLKHSQSQHYPPTSINAIVSNMSHPTISPRKNPMDIQSSLMSPPEPVLHDSFSRPSTSDSNMEISYGKPATAQYDPPLSPPVSPEDSTGTPDSPSNANRDPILFPQEQETQDTSSTHPSLFPTQQVVEDHIRNRDSSVFAQTSPPRREDYDLVLRCQMMGKFVQNPQKYQMQAWIQAKADQEARRGGPRDINQLRRYTPIAPASNGSRKAGGRANGPRTSPNGGIAKPRVPKAPKGDRQQTPDAGGKRVAREDKDFESLPDFSPPIGNSLDKPNALKIDWKGQPIDLKNDPHADKLHPHELACAANLRLDCATYLTSKRRIFISRVNALNIPKEFRKTDAQQACKIDVNKASKLWSAFEKVGWLKPELFQQYIGKKLLPVEGPSGNA